MNTNYRLAGQRNMDLGKLTYAKGLLLWLLHHGKFIPDEKIMISAALDKLLCINMMPAKERQKIFGKIHGFKKYQNKNENI